MRYLLLTRGMPLCGKTTWIQQYNLEPYVLNHKFFQSLLHAPMLDDSGKFVKDTQKSKLAYSMLFTALESRMERGEFVIIEDQHIAKSYCSHYKELAKYHAYKILIIDFSSVPFETICKRNSQINELYSIEELQELYDTLQNSEIPIKCKIIQPDEIKSLLKAEPHNLNGYKKIHHIGDIHGSYHVLQQYIGTMKNDEFYIFLGDYIDRGFQNYEVLQFLLRIMERKNVCLLEGNHEKWLWYWANNREVEAKEFRFNTQVELEQKGFSKQDASRLYTKLEPYFFYKFHDKRIICTHGGISNIPEYPILLSATQSIQGVGSYLNASSISQAFAQNVPDNFYQVFGHRNKTDLPIQLYNKSFILEDKVEFGGYLRTLQLSQHGFVDKSLRNTIFVNQEEKEAKRKLQKFFDHIANNKKFTLTKHKDFTSINYPKKISKDVLELAYSFSPCIIDTKKWQIVGRGYHLNMDKKSHFRANNTEMIDKIAMPLYITRKLFGNKFIITYYNGKFYIYKDFSIETRLPKFLQDKAKQAKLSHIFKNQSHSMLCLQTSINETYLLDIFANQPQSNIYTYNEKENIAKLLNIKTQKPLFTLKDKIQFDSFIKTFNKYNMSIAKSNALQIININLDSINDDMQTKLLEINTEQHNINDLIMQNNKTLDLHIIESITIESCFNTNIQFCLNGFHVVSSDGYFFEIPTLYDHEMQVIAELIKIWRMRNSITTLTWINNNFRLAFMQWFSNFVKQNKLECMPTVWIQNAFLNDLSQKQIDFTFTNHNLKAE